LPLLQKIDDSVDVHKVGAGTGDGGCLVDGAGHGGEEPNVAVVEAKPAKEQAVEANRKRIHNQIASPQMLGDGSAVFVFTEGIATDLSAKQFTWDSMQHYVKRVKSGEAGKECTYAEVKKMVSAPSAAMLLS
jgi:hypothetical protein